MSNNFRLTATTKTWTTSVVPVCGGGVAYVRPDAVLNGTAMRPFGIDGLAAAAHQGQGPQSWSPPVT
ncbi:MAG TPA: hypothetical protein VFO98_12095 [Marmoricola sp.]|jgi:hypothetical protein|nr:hypothetical protein [Marmoricola sp.]